MPRVRGTTDAENSAGGSSAEMFPFQSGLRYRHDGIAESAGSRKHNPNNSRHLPRDALDMTATETFDIFRRFWLKYYDAMEVLVMDRGTEFGADFQHLCQYRDTLLVVTDPETPWSIPIVESHEALFKMTFEKACSLEAPTTEAEVDELIAFTFAELNRLVERAGFSTSQRASGRQLRLPSSLLEGDASSAGRQWREAAKRGHGSRPKMRSRRRQQGDDDSRSQQPTETSVGAGDWRNRCHTQAEERSPRMVWPWIVRIA